MLLRELGFGVTFVSVEGLNADPGLLDGLDALFASIPLEWAALTPDAQQALRTWVTGGGGVVAAGAAHLPFVEAALLPAMGWVEPNVNANGVVAVTNRVDSPVMPGRAAEGASFGYPPSWFLASFPEFSVEQRYAAGDTVLLGGTGRPRSRVWTVPSTPRPRPPVVRSRWPGPWATERRASC